MRIFIELIVIPLFVGVGAELIAEWLIRKYFNKRDKK